MTTLKSKATQRGENDSSWMERLSPPRIWLLAATFALFSFVTKEIMYTLLVSDVGRRDERYMAEAISSILLGFLLGKLLQSASKLHHITLARVQIAAEMNHHVRNALQSIVFHCRQGEMPSQALARIDESIKRVDWALREILPRQAPATLANSEESLFQWSQASTLKNKLPHA